MPPHFESIDGKFFPEFKHQPASQNPRSAQLFHRTANEFSQKTKIEFKEVADDLGPPCSLQDLIDTTTKVIK